MNEIIKKIRKAIETYNMLLLQLQKEPIEVKYDIYSTLLVGLPQWQCEIIFKKILEKYLTDNKNGE